MSGSSDFPRASALDDARTVEGAETVDAYAVLGVRPDADTAGPITGTDTTLATAHALLEERLPRTVVAGLPRSRLLSALTG